MEIAIIKIGLACGFFVSLIVAAYWAGNKLNDYKDFWDDE